MVTTSLIDLCHPVTMDTKGLAVTSPSPSPWLLFFQAEGITDLCVHCATRDVDASYSFQMKSNTLRNSSGADGQWFTPLHLAGGRLPWWRVQTEEEDSDGWTETGCYKTESVDTVGASTWDDNKSLLWSAVLFFQSADVQPVEQISAWPRMSPFFIETRCM